MSPNDADGMANSVDPGQTALGAVCSGSALFAQAFLSEKDHYGMFYFTVWKI